ncbi:MAG TPA: ferric reductase-like transmembrane domain-containing protein [Candidatus Dormibacteraeota bacterium]
MIAASGPTPLWYAARSTGYVSLLMLTAILVLGIVTSMRWAGRDWPRFMSQAVHRNLSLLVLVFLALHILTSTIDPFAGISLFNSVVPFTGSYRPLWLGLGVVSLELLVALTVTSVLRRRISFTVWRVVHWMAYACWPLALLHTLGTGSDVRSAWAIVVSLGCVGVVLLAIAWRLLGAQTVGRRPVRVAGLAMTAATTIALVGFAVAGPLHNGWARVAGTPAQLLATTAVAGATASPTPAAAAVPTGLDDSLSGTLVQGPNDVSVQLSDARDATLRITVMVVGQATSGQLSITRAGATICNVVASVAQDVQASCGQTSVDISLTRQPDGTITGQLVTQVLRQ